MRFLFSALCRFGILIGSNSAFAIALRSVGNCTVGAVKSEETGTSATLNCPSKQYVVTTNAASLERILLSAKTSRNQVAVTFTAPTDSVEVWTLRSMALPE